MGTVTLAYSDTKDGINNGTNGCISTNPQFNAVAVNDYSLSSASPCINKGTNLPCMVCAGDLAGNSRIVRGFVDMGAYEAAPPRGTILTIR